MIALNGFAALSDRALVTMELTIADHSVGGRLRHETRGVSLPHFSNHPPANPRYVDGLALPWGGHRTATAKIKRAVPQPPTMGGCHNRKKFGDGRLTVGSGFPAISEPPPPDSTGSTQTRKKIMDPTKLGASVPRNGHPAPDDTQTEAKYPADALNIPRSLALNPALSARTLGVLVHLLACTACRTVSDLMENGCEVSE